MPHFPLAMVHEAVREDRVELGGRRFIERLCPYVQTYVEMREFTKAVLLELVPGDFINTLAYEDAVCDAYGVAISAGLQARFSVEGLETWYVKFTVDEALDGSVVVMASLHEPEGPLARVGGTVPVRFRRSEE